MNYRGDDAILILLILSFLSFLIGGLSGWTKGSDDRSTIMIKWVEDCWPNKPVWTERPGVCWVNGQKVILPNQQ